MARYFRRTSSVILLLIISASVVVGCRGKTFSDKNFFAPRYLRLGSPDPNAPPDYLDGWNDGCESGKGTMVQSYHKMFYGYKRDHSRDNNPMYYKAWKDAYTYCRQYAFRYSWAAYDDKPFKMGNPLCLFCSQIR